VRERSRDSLLAISRDQVYAGGSTRAFQRENSVGMALMAIPANASFKKAKFLYRRGAKFARESVICSMLYDLVYPLPEFGFSEVGARSRNV
jgi:hypothetical protein